MNNPEGAPIYLKDKEFYYKEAFSRNIGLLSEDEQKKLASCKVAIAGMGAVGGIHLITLARLGIGKFHIADMDKFELANIQRQYGANVNSMGMNKAEVMRDLVLSINPHLDIKVFPIGISNENIDEFLSGADIVIDGIDFFSIDTRRLLFQKAREHNLYTLTAGPIGFGSALLIFSPTGMGFDKYFDIKEKMSYLEKIVAFGVGLAPASIHMSYFKLDSIRLDTKKGPALASACNLCSVFVATETLNILLNRKTPKAVPFFFQFDPYMLKFKKGYLLFGNKNPIQKLKRWFLIKRFSSLNQ